MRRQENLFGTWLVLVIILMFVLGMGFARPSLQTPTHAIGRDQPYTYYRDTIGLSLEQFLALSPDEVSIGTRPFTEGYARDPYWVRFEAPADWFTEGPLWLQIMPGYLDHLALYWRALGVDAPWQHRQLGDRDNVQTTADSINYRFPALQLPPPPTDSPGYEFVAQLQSSSTLMLEPSFWEPAAFVSHATRDSVFWAFFLGMSTLSSALSLLLAISFGTRLLWSVVPFSVGYLLVACIQGFVGWSSAAWRVDLQHYLIGILTLTGYPALLWICVEALELRRRMPRVYRVALIGIGVSLLLPLSIPLDLYGNAITLLTLAALFTMPLILGCALWIWWRTRTTIINLFFGLAPMFYVGSSLLALLTTTALIDYDPVVYHFWQYCAMLVMMTMMLLVMATGVSRIRRERHALAEQRRLEQELRQERRARAHQQQFMGMISHELRTPLAVIAATLTNLRSMAVPDAALSRRYDKMERATLRLVQLTDNCLADARLSAGELHLDLQPIDVLQQARQVLKLSEVEGRRVQLTVNGVPVPAPTSGGSTTPLPPSASSTPLLADGALLRIALSNLIDNAVKYSTPGGAIRLDLASDDKHWRLAVEDEGPGIDPDRAEIIFERYRQADASDETESAGWGLGLYVARQIIRAHGGELTLSINTPHCCRFEASLPKSPQPQEMEPANRSLPEAALP